MQHILALAQFWLHALALQVPSGPLVMFTTFVGMDFPFFVSVTTYVIFRLDAGLKCYALLIVLQVLHCKLARVCVKRPHRTVAYTSLSEHRVCKNRSVPGQGPPF